MTDNFSNASNHGLRYTSPQVKVVEVNARGIMCQSPGVNGYENGSNSDGGEMGEEGE